MAKEEKDMGPNLFWPVYMFYLIIYQRISPFT